MMQGMYVVHVVFAEHSLGVSMRYSEVRTPKDCGI